MLLPGGPQELLGYCYWSGLTSLVSQGGIAASEYKPQYNVLPLKEVRTATFRDADPLIELIRREVSDLSSDWEEYLRICVNEVIQNIQDHARSEVGGILAARFMSAGAEVRVAIVDRGEGIRTTLARRFPDTTIHNCLRRVLQGEYSALSRENNAGLGLNHLKLILTHLQGELYLVSGESSAHMARNGVLVYNQLGFPLVGTAVFFTVPSKRSQL